MYFDKQKDLEAKSLPKKYPQLFEVVSSYIKSYPAYKPNITWHQKENLDYAQAMMISFSFFFSFFLASLCLSHSFSPSLLASLLLSLSPFYSFDTKQLCYKENPIMALILEDDVMATNHYVSKFFDYLFQIPEGANCIQSCCFMVFHYFISIFYLLDMDIKLFYPEFYCGFSSCESHFSLFLL